MMWVPEIGLLRRQELQPRLGGQVPGSRMRILRKTWGSAKETGTIDEFEFFNDAEEPLSIIAVGRQKCLFESLPSLAFLLNG